MLRMLLVFVQVTFLITLSAAAFVVEAEDGAPKVDHNEVLQRLIDKEGLGLKIYHVGFFQTITPAPNEKDIVHRAEVITDVRDWTASTAILGRLKRSLKPCDLEEDYEFYDVRLRIDVLSGSSSNGDMLVSDGYVMKLNGVETLGCMGDMLRFLYGMGDVGYFGYDEYDEMLRKELGCCNSSASEQEGIRGDDETD